MHLRNGFNISCMHDIYLIQNHILYPLLVPLSVELRIAASNLTQLESTTVECNVSGAVPSLTLRRNGQLLTQVNEDHLTFTTSPQSYGTYTCAAGGLQSSAILQEQGTI